MRELEALTAQMLAAGSDDQARNRLLSQVYEDLLKIARAELSRHARGATLNTRALVNEAYLKLFAGAGAAYLNRKHFFATAAQAMRQVSIDYARQRVAQRRGGGVPILGLDDIEAESLSVDHQAEGLLALDNALRKLAALDPRLAEVIELRFFAGMEVDALAELLEVSVPTVIRDTRAARAWLQRELGSD